MKIVKLIIFTIGFLVIFLIGYGLGNVFPFSGFSSVENGISGKETLEVKLEMNDGAPVVDVEVDVAEKPGPPPQEGITTTNEKGIATFNLKPGSYFVFFNSNNFPKNLQIPEAEKVIVEEGKLNQKTIILQRL